MPLLLEQLGELAHVVLRLRDGEAVAGHDDDLARERELHGDVVRRRRAHRAPVVPRAGAGAGLHLAEGAEQDVRDRAVHRLRHHQREERARGADEHPGDDQHGRVEHEARRRGCKPGEGVQQRDHDGHVGAADRQHEHDAEEQREPDQGDEHPLAPRPRRRARSPRPAAPSRIAALKTFWPTKTIGRPETSSWSFAKATSEPENEIDPISAESTMETSSSPRERTGGDVELRERDQRRRAAADPVEQGHHLRHRGHLHGAGADDADDGSDRARRRRSGPSWRSRRAAASSRSRSPSRRRRPSCPCARASATRGTAARR